ncbi:MAG TPA: hypothetical protein VF635_03885 [Propionibacteriaceae bacterium]
MPSLVERVVFAAALAELVLLNPPPRHLERGEQGGGAVTHEVVGALLGVAGGMGNVF